MEILENLKFTHDYWQVVLPLILMFADVVTGYIAAKINNTVQSDIMRKGLGKKVAELMYILVGIAFGIAFGMPAVATFIALYIIYMEIVSLMENCKKLGLITDNSAIEKLTGKLNNKDKEE